jgi:hypothetical protein
MGGVIPCTDGGVLCTTQFRGSQAITIRPSTWDVTGSSLDITFSLGQFISQGGSGVYTIYLTQNTFANNPNDTESLTSISIFVQT